ncbi:MULTISPECIES: alpha/beta fold hydrolase [unclassified Bradyrhizobium]|uniref:alpha/beta fold hydrolase n=1 Tax=unclassified Bradyrhizobium TaxID=2631580 RepID=UPI00068542F5|nr:MULTISPECIES: alpha/beta fold hydrolase [unclassified Bradyrhizobium]MCP3467869.1 alpha/beta fold hydrolase [Bradyrhizobium sp. CCGUVB23]
MNTDVVLIAGPLVRASSWEPTAEKLRDSGWRVQVPDILAHHVSPPAWSAWSRSLVNQIAPANGLVLIGHSSASALAADLATKLPTKAVVIVDGDIPPIEGAAYPVRPALRAFIQNLARADGSLPVWSKWFDGDGHRASLVGIDILKSDRNAFARFESGLPKMNISWFDETVDLARWDHIPAGFIQASKLYDHATVEARGRGWPVINSEGTHLDPTLRPAETANAIAVIARTLGAIP